MIVDQSEEAQKEFLEQENIPVNEDESHIMIVPPKQVKCKKCGKTFIAEEPFSHSSDEDSEN